jgi:hypothetical protein
VRRRDDQCRDGMRARATSCSGRPRWTVTLSHCESDFAEGRRNNHFASALICSVASTRSCRASVDADRSPSGLPPRSC